MLRTGVLAVLVVIGIAALAAAVRPGPSELNPQPEPPGVVGVPAAAGPWG